MPTFQVVGTGTLQHDGTTYNPGDSIELTDEQAQDLIVDGAIAPFEGKVPKATKQVEDESDNETDGEAGKPAEPKLADLTKVQLVEKAKSLKIGLTGDETKTALTQMIEDELKRPAEDL